LAEIISEQCTAIETDCIAVLTVLKQNIVRKFKQGRIVRLEKLSNFQVGLSQMILKPEKPLNLAL
jgi:hypothetical protein